MEVVLKLPVSETVVVGDGRTECGVVVINDLLLLGGFGHSARSEKERWRDQYC